MYKKIFITLLVILFIELLLGYRLFLRETRHYNDRDVSATLRMYDHLSRKIENYKIKKKQVSLMNESTEQKKLRKKKETIKEKCSVLENKNQKISLKTQIISKKININFFNSEIFKDINNDRIFKIVFIGGSEMAGSIHDEGMLYHNYLQESLQKKYNTKNILVFNLAQDGYRIEDIKFAIDQTLKLFKPNLVITHTGANDLILFKRQLHNEFSESIYHKKMNEWINLNQIIYSCNENRNIIFNKPDKLESLLKERLENKLLNYNSFLRGKNLDYITGIQGYSPKHLTVRPELEILESNFEKLNVLNLSKVNDKVPWADANHSYDPKLIVDEYFNEIVDVHSETILKFFEN